MKILSMIALCIGLLGFRAGAFATPQMMADTVECSTAGFVASAGAQVPIVFSGFDGVLKGYIAGKDGYLPWRHNNTFPYPPVNMRSGNFSTSLYDIDTSYQSNTKALALASNDTDEWMLAEVDSGVYDNLLETSPPVVGLLQESALELNGASNILKSVVKIKHYAASVPEPTTLFLFGTGLAGIAAIGRRRFKR